MICAAHGLRPGRMPHRNVKRSLSLTVVATQKATAARVVADTRLDLRQPKSCEVGTAPLSLACAATWGRTCGVPKGKRPKTWQVTVCFFFPVHPSGFENSIQFGHSLMLSPLAALKLPGQPLSSGLLHLHPQCLREREPALA